MRNLIRLAAVITAAVLLIVVIVGTCFLLPILVGGGQ